MNDANRYRMYTETMNRRKILKYGIAAGAVGLAGCMGGENPSEDSSSESGASGDESGTVSLSVASPTIGFPVEDPIGKSFMEDYDVEMSLKSIPATPAELIQLFVAGDGENQFDVVWDNGGGMEELLGSRGSLAEVDPSRIPNWSDRASAFQDDGYLYDTMTYDGTLMGVPSARNADSIAYLRDQIDEPDSWGVVFDDQYRGQTAIIDDYANAPHWTALYLRENDRADVHNADLLSDSQWNAIDSIEGDKINNLNADQLDAVIEYLIGQKNLGQFRTIWQSFGNVSNLLKNGEVVASYAYEPSVVALQAEGVDIGYPAMREGNFEWDDHWFMTSGAPDRGRDEGYYRLAEYSLTAEYGAMMNDTRGFSTGVPVAECMAYAEENFSAERAQRNQELFDLRQARFDANGPTHAWNNPNPDLLDTYLDEWNRFLNA